MVSEKPAFNKDIVDKMRDILLIYKMGISYKTAMDIVAVETKDDADFLNTKIRDVLDSLDYIEYIMDLEDYFGINIVDKKYSLFKELHDMIQHTIKTKQ